MCCLSYLSLISFVFGFRGLQSVGICSLLQRFSTGVLFRHSALRTIRVFFVLRKFVLPSFLQLFAHSRVSLLAFQSIKSMDAAGFNDSIQMEFKSRLQEAVHNFCHFSQRQFQKSAKKRTFFLLLDKKVFQMPVVVGFSLSAFAMRMAHIKYKLI